MQIGFLGCRITRDSTCTVLCDQEKYILHCVHENSFVSESQTVTLKPSHRPPEVDERLPDESLPEAVKKETCVRLPAIHRTTNVAGHKTRPDISAVLGICASMMVKTPRRNYPNNLQISQGCQRYSPHSPGKELRCRDRGLPLGSTQLSPTRYRCTRTKSIKDCPGSLPLVILMGAASGSKIFWDLNPHRNAPMLGKRI